MAASHLGGARQLSLRAPWRLVITAAAVAALVAGVIDFVVAPLQGRFGGSLYDLHAYLGGARAAVHHTDIYAGFLSQLSNPQLGGFDYPPVVAWMLEPLTWLPFRMASMAWLWLMLTCTALAALQLSRALLPRSWPRLQLAALATFAFIPATFNLRLGQMEPAILLLLTLALLAWLRGRQLTCGALIGLAASIKLAPLVLVILLVRRRWWKGAAAAAGTVVVASVLGVLTAGAGSLVEYVSRVLPALLRQDGWLYNQSIGGVVNRVANHSVLTIESPLVAVTLAGAVLSGALLIVAALSTRASPESPQGRGMEFALGVMAMLLAGSITWYLHYVLLLIPCFAIAGWLASTRVRGHVHLIGALVVCLLATGLAGAILADATFVDLFVADHATLTWWMVLQLSSLPAISLLILFVACAGELRKGRRLSLRSEPGYRPA